MSEGVLFSIVLAAGAARRFGSPKQLAEYQGTTLVQRAVGLAAAVTGHNSVLVVGADWRAVAASCRPLGGFLALNERYDQGMAGSIACGIRSIDSVADAALIILADQPLIKLSQLQQLRQIWNSNRSSIVASEFADTTGPPVIFPAGFFPELTALQDDRGARSLLRQHASSVIGVACADAAFDVDTPQDLRGLAKK